MNWRSRARERMRSLRLNRDDLAKILGITGGAVGHYLSGRSQPSVETFMKICMALDVSADWLLFGRANAQPSAQVSKSALRVASAWEKLPKDRQRDIEGALRVFSKDDAL